MTEDQQKATVSKLIPALQKASLRDAWVAAFNSGQDGFIAFLRSNFGLGNDVSVDNSDMVAMSKYANQFFAKALNDLKALDARIETNCICNGLDQGLPPCPPPH
jgi:hypothetical protein